MSFDFSSAACRVVIDHDSPGWKQQVLEAIQYMITVSMVGHDGPDRSPGARHPYRDFSPQPANCPEDRALIVEGDEIPGPPYASCEE